MSTKTAPTSTRRCACCGSPQAEWPNPGGFGGNFCCVGCATGHACTCGAASEKPSPSPAAIGVRDEESEMRMDDDLG